MADILGTKYENDVVTTVTLTPPSQEITWTTFEGVTKTLSTIDHQHISNIYWFMKLVNPDFYDKSTKTLIAGEIDKRFDGELLPYRPLPRFRGEIESLRRKGYLRERVAGAIVEVVVDGEVVGVVAQEKKRL